ncbi:galactose mutarotase [Patella vulgata]|uniref:galactose mutarotase n=1 Tax=Patella vulgata TaxID=6465 RepID=UPI00217FAF7A|nr:galactose mutarotase [Patella vulgata]XP_050404154.1 galactose mutarotase [Patella vulgata]
MGISEEIFGKSKQGAEVKRYTLTNKNGITVKILDYGGIITDIHVPDKDGKMGDIALGFDDMPGYEERSPYMGAIIGRVANRIAGGQFELDGQKYSLFINNGPNSLHGGKIGFDKVIWKSAVNGDKLSLTYVSADGEENYPGEVTVHVDYQLDDENRLNLNYRATTTKSTPINLTNHSYFNLGGHASGSIDDHVVTIHADSYLPLDDTSIPTGEIRKVDGSLMDLRSGVKMVDKLSVVNEGKGYDNNFNINDTGSLQLAARVDHPPTGRFMECYTTCPGLQFYTSYYFDDITGKAGAVYRRFDALALEAQGYPNSINQKNFPSIVLHPEETYQQQTVYKFGVKN